MAFISTEKTKEIRENLKKEFPNLKFSVTNMNFTKINVVIKSGNIDFASLFNSDDLNGITVSEYSFDKDFKDELIVKMFEKMFKIIKGESWYDNSDVMVDYFDVAYYFSLKVGDWNKNYTFIENKKVA